MYIYKNYYFFNSGSEILIRLRNLYQFIKKQTKNTIVRIKTYFNRNG